VKEANRGLLCSANTCISVRNLFIKKQSKYLSVALKASHIIFYLSKLFGRLLWYLRCLSPTNVSNWKVFVSICNRHWDKMRQESHLHQLLLELIVGNSV